MNDLAKVPGSGELSEGAAVTMPVRPPPAREQWLFGEVVRPRGPLGARLRAFDAEAARAVPDVVAVVARGNFLAVVARSPEQAAAGAAALRPVWSDAGGRADQRVPRRRRIVASHGDAASALAAAPSRLEQTYRWPLAGIAPPAATAIADWREGELRVWLPDGRPGALRAELAKLLDIAETAVTLVCWHDGADMVDMAGGAAGASVSHHAAADAALLAQAVGGPVLVRFDAAAFDDAAGWIETRIASATNGGGPAGNVVAISAYQVTATPMPVESRPLASLQTGTPSALSDIRVDDDAALVPPYWIDHLEAVSTDTAHPTAALAVNPLAGAVAQVFARESHLDEAAALAGVDPVALRLNHLQDERGAALVRQVALQAAWQTPALRGATRDASAGVRRGRGFAYASVLDADGGQPMQSWAAWVADVEVDAFSGEVSVTRVTLGHDSGESTPSPSSRGGRAHAPALEHDIAEATRRLTAPAPSFDSWHVAPDAATALPATVGTLPPEVRVVGGLTTTAGLRGSAAATLPAAAAIANAIFDATGVRLREPPFSGERVRLALAGECAEDRPARRKRNWLLAAGAAIAALCATVMPWRSAIAPVAPPEPGFYSAATIERGRLVAAAGDCAVCHTAPNGARNAGGLPLETPFGTIYSTNITPDVDTGIGNWSYAAFERAMREGIHRDGRRLYPAFPYTAFAKISDGDMRALYAYLMSAEPVRSQAPETALAFPFNLRPLMAGWNLLFHRNEPFQPDPSRSLQWNRGAYLAEGLGHCSACHSPRNAFGAEKGGRAYLTGGEAEGWEAPALTALSRSPIPWTEEDLFQYLRTGYSARHGAAAGPMAPVVEELAQLPESDVRAIAHYVASFKAPPPDAAALDRQARALEQRSATLARTMTGPADRLYQSACAVCHQSDQGVPMFGVKPSLALNTNLHGDKPDNVIQAVLKGIPAPPSNALGEMPGFADSFDDKQVAELVHYLRARFAPDKPAWQGVDQAVARIRGSASAAGHGAQ
ncbi:c-type cytochrome [Cupriavidus sp. UGS-1]|nr:c-type cytochrome [Cupriavidus sp. UGS-1]MCD9121785.1 c-type cytochrome [Cupriavidus sp. UGS-1]